MVTDPSNNWPSLKISSDDVQEKFSKKIKQVATQEKELETMKFAASIGFPHIDLDRFPIGQQALRQLPQELVIKKGVVCFYFTTEEFRLGALDPRPEDIQQILYDLEESNHARGLLYVISEKSLKKVLDLYNTLPVVKPITKDIEIHQSDLDQLVAEINDFSSLQRMLEKASVTNVLTILLGAALKLDASDLHIESEENRIMVRFRLDGILHDAAIMPKETFRQLVSRIKLVSSLKINITEVPQDGRFTIKLKYGDVDVRVSTLPTVYGESVVMRVLKQSRHGLTLEKIGLYGDSYTKLRREIERPNGMIITTGPTGSGKTTTLYAMMQLLNKPGVKIITLEDPVEYRMEGINQSQIDRSKDYTFAKALRSILRQDPDIAMVGEIRDLETADIAIQSALTGHLILSTIHTNSAAGAIPRFLSMGVKPFLLAPALNSVIGQRLVRKLCNSCKKISELSVEDLKRVEEVINSMPEEDKALAKNKERIFYEAKGCAECSGIGYKGRIGIYEIMLMTPDIEQLILSGQVSEYEIEKNAISAGMVTMLQDGILKSLEGITSLSEVFRVVQ